MNIRAIENACFVSSYPEKKNMEHANYNILQPYDISANYVMNI